MIRKTETLVGPRRGGQHELQITFARLCHYCSIDSLQCCFASRIEFFRNFIGERDSLHESGLVPGSTGTHTLIAPSTNPDEADVDRLLGVTNELQRARRESGCVQERVKEFGQVRSASPHAILAKHDIC